MGSLPKRRCARRQDCYHVRKLGLSEPITLADSNKSGLCEQCKAIDEREIILTFSDPEDAPSERRFRVLDTRAGSEIRSLKRDMVLDLYLQRGNFWEGVKLVRNRWGIEPTTDFPPSPIYGELMPPGLSDQPPLGLETEKTAWFEEYEAWIRDLEYVARAKIPPVYLGERFRPDWGSFISVCVFFQPSVSGALSTPKLLEFAELGGPWAESLPLKPGKEPAGGPYMAVKPPVHFTRNPAERVNAETTYWKGVVHALWELYLEPRGISLETALEAVHEAYPALEEDRGRSITGDHLSDRGWVEFDDQTRKKDWEWYRWMIDQRRTTKPKLGRDKRHPLQCVECVVLSIQHRWPNDRLAKRYEWGSADTADNYIRNGERLLTRL